MEECFFSGKKARKMGISQKIGWVCHPYHLGTPLTDEATAHEGTFTSHSDTCTQVQSVCSRCTHNAQSVHGQCTVSARSVHSQCTVSARSVHSQWAVSAQSVHSQCTVSARSVHGQCTASAQLVGSQWAVSGQSTQVCVKSAYSQ